MFFKEKRLTEPYEDLTPFYQLPWQGRLGTGAYLARVSFILYAAVTFKFFTSFILQAVVNALLKDNETNAISSSSGISSYDTNSSCTIS